LKLQAQTQARAEIEEKLKAETQARLKAEKIAAAEAQERAKAETKAQSQAQAKAQAKVKAESADRAKADAEAKARAESEAKAEAERQARENDTQMKTIKHFRLHIETGDIYAIEQRADASLVGSCGPLVEKNLKDLNSYGYSDEQNNWVQENIDRLILWFP
jgi:membrane protein involved in colicin uptake